MKNNPLQKRPGKAKLQHRHLLTTLILDDYIQVVKEKDENKQEVIYGLNLNLNPEIISIFKEVPPSTITIKVSKELLNNFRYYALFGQGNSFNTGMTFSSYYQQEQFSQPVIRSFISLDGDIIQQVSNDCLASPRFNLDIIRTHCWLINCLIAELRLDITNKLNGVSWLLSLLTVGGFGAVNLEQIQTLDPITYFVPIIMSWLFKQGFQRLLRLIVPRLGRWFIRQMLFGIFSKTQKMRAMALRVLSMIGV
ncbi:MAG: hypothetical protein WA896_09280 [Spirulinaceae cyanobacterium]